MQERVYAVIVAAGKGRRMATAVGKQYLMLQGKPVVLHTLMVFDALDSIEGIILVVPPDDIQYVKNEVLSGYRYSKHILVTGGGSERQQSVYNGLKVIPAEVDIVAIHDGVRPLITSQIIDLSINAASVYGAAVVGVPVKETIKQVDLSCFVISTPSREQLWTVQTPQTFRYKIIEDAHERAVREGFIGTDDAMLVERMGARIKMVQGSYRNIKVTTCEDLLIAEQLFELTGGCR